MLDDEPRMGPDLLEQGLMGSLSSVMSSASSVKIEVSQFFFKISSIATPPMAKRIEGELLFQSKVVKLETASHG